MYLYDIWYMYITKPFYSGKYLKFEDKVGVKEDVPIERGIKEISDIIEHLKLSLLLRYNNKRPKRSGCKGPI